MAKRDPEFIQIMIQNAARDPEIRRYFYSSCTDLVDVGAGVDLSARFASLAGPALSRYDIADRVDIDAVYAEGMFIAIQEQQDGQA